MKWRRRIAAAAGILALAFVIFAVVTLLQETQRADLGWDPGVTDPAFPPGGPRVVIDEAHHNASTAGIRGRYRPFARLLRADGYTVRRNRDAFTRDRLEGVQILVVANARGAPKPQFLGVNLPARRTSARSEDPAFTEAEVEAVRAWVEDGGSLLLVADHAPMGAASERLAAVFGVTMHKGFVEVPGETSDPLLFSRENGRLGDHPIIAGDGTRTSIKRVMTFTGQSLDGPGTASALLRLPGGAVEYVPAGPEFLEHPAGAAQALAFEYGAGRVVVLGEAAMITAQVHKGERFGMNSPGNDNKQFARNVLRWLSRRM